MANSGMSLYRAKRDKKMEKYDNVMFLSIANVYTVDCAAYAATLT